MVSQVPVVSGSKTARGYVAPAALEPHFRERLLRDLGIDGPDGRNVEQAFLARDAKEWAAERDLPLAAVRDPETGRSNTPSSVSCCRRMSDRFRRQPL